LRALERAQRGSAKQRRRFKKKRRGEPSQGETAAADDDNGDKCDDCGSHTEDNEDELCTYNRARVTLLVFKGK